MSAPELTTSLATGSKQTSLPALLRRVRAEYYESTGLILSRSEMQRLCGIDPLMCDALIASLLDTRIVRRVRNDRYAAFGSPT